MAFPQAVVNQESSAVTLVNALVGSGVNVSNISLNCDSAASGIFTNGFPISQGIILSTGKAIDASGPNDLINTSSNFGLGGDNDLDNITNGFSTFDACVLEFDIHPYCDSLNFSFAFLSEEYPEYVGRAFNDVVGIFITGTNPNNISAPYNNYNIAEVNSNPININSVNTTSNSAYYSTTNNFEYDGGTISIDKTVAVVACSTYHVKIAIADGDDGVYDAALILQENTFNCGQDYTSTISQLQLREGCADSIFINRNISTTVDTLDLSFSGAAINGIDVVTLPNRIPFPIGVSRVGIPIHAIRDNIADPIEDLYITYTDNPCGLYDSIIVNILPEYNISAGLNQSACIDESVQIGTPALNLPNINYLWTPSNNLDNNIISNPNFLSQNAGTYKLYLNTTIDNCLYLDSTEVTIFAKPTASFSYTANCANQLAFFNSDNVQQLYEWDFGDGNQALGSNVTNAFGSSGMYNTSLIITDSNGCKDTTSRTIIINPSPIANFTVSDTCIGFPICPNNTSTGAIGYQWDFDTIDTLNLVSPCYTFTSSGIKQIKLNTVNSFGCVDSIVKTVSIHVNPNANFKIENSCHNEWLDVTNQSTINYGTINYDWSFGDGTSSNIKDPLKKYATPADYDVRLIVTSNEGCIDSITKNVTIHSIPQANFSISADTACEEACIDIMHAVVNDLPPTLFKWDLGDGTQSNDSNFMHCYKVAGSYDIELIAENSAGCKDTARSLDPIVILEKPTASFSLSESVINDYDPEVIVDNFSSSNVTTNIWSFSNKTTDTIINNSSFTYDYIGAGRVYTTLIVMNKEGCTDSLTQSILINITGTVFVPNVFSPNGNGKNDFFFIKGINLEHFIDFNLSIYNRWGETIFETSNPFDRWDGSYNGSPSPSDVYVYKLKYTIPNEDEKTKYGNVFLLR